MNSNELDTELTGAWRTSTYPHTTLYVHDTGNACIELRLEPDLTLLRFYSQDEVIDYVQHLVGTSQQVLPEFTPSDVKR